MFSIIQCILAQRLASKRDEKAINIVRSSTVRAKHLKEMLAEVNSEVERVLETPDSSRKSI